MEDYRRNVVRIAPKIAYTLIIEVIELENLIVQKITVLVLVTLNYNSFVKVVVILIVVNLAMVIELVNSRHFPMIV